MRTSRVGVVALATCLLALVRRGIRTATGDVIAALAIYVVGDAVVPVLQELGLVFVRGCVHVEVHIAPAEIRVVQIQCVIPLVEHGFHRGSWYRVRHVDARRGIHDRDGRLLAAAVGVQRKVGVDARVARVRVRRRRQVEVGVHVQGVHAVVSHVDLHVVVQVLGLPVDHFIVVGAGREQYQRRPARKQQQG